MRIIRWTVLCDDEREKKEREDKRKIKEYFNILLGKQYSLLRIEKYNPKELLNNLNDTTSK